MHGIPLSLLSPALHLCRRRFASSLRRAAIRPEQLHLSGRNMSSAIFNVKEHILPSSHIREYPRALAGDQEDILQLAVRQYTPKSHGTAKQGITIIGAHANGFPKVSSSSCTSCSGRADTHLHFRSSTSLSGTICIKVFRQRIST